MRMTWSLIYTLGCLVCYAVSSPHVSGVRVQNEYNKPGFLGYKDSGIILVEPHVPVSVVVFGTNLEKVEQVSFTDSICLTSEFNVSNHDFLVHKGTTILFSYSFPAWETPWRLCVKEKGVLDSIQIDDDRTWIQTTTNKHDAIMPIYLQIPTIIVLCAISALCSGLNIGLMTFTTEELKIIINSGDQDEVKRAKKILPVREKGWRLLATLLIVNVIVNSAIAILFEDIWPGFLAFVLSSAGIVIFGEIVPQSACVRYGLLIGAATSNFVSFLMIMTAPISYPIGMALDYILGKQVSKVDRNRLLENLKMSLEQARKDNQELSTVNIAVGAMELVNKKASDAMTKIENVFMLSEDTVLNIETLTEISERGYSRIPVYEGTNREKVKSLLHVSDLALIGKGNNITVNAVSDFHQRKLRIVDEDTPLLKLLEEFKKGDYHMALVAKYGFSAPEANEANSLEFPHTKEDEPIMKAAEALLETVALVEGERPKFIVGLITLEDVMEEILQTEIIDESDSILDNVQRNRRNRGNKKSLAESVCKESRSEILSIQLFEMVEKWLREKCTFFDFEHIERKVLEQTIQRNVRQVSIVASHHRMESNSVNLYNAGVQSNRFILILEGKATVTFVESTMSFEVGSWTAFGTSLLDVFAQNATNNRELPSGLSLTADFDLTVTNYCRYLQLPVTSLIYLARMTHLIRQLPNPGFLRTENKKDSVVNRSMTTVQDEKIRVDFSPNASTASRMRSATSAVASLSFPVQQLASRSPSVRQISEVSDL